MKKKFIKNRKIYNPKGSIFKVLQKNIKEVYFSEINPKNIKAWKLHAAITSYIQLIKGEVVFVLFKSKKFHIYKLTEKKNGILIIPKKTWYGFKSITKKKSKLLSMIDKKHSDRELKRLEENEIDFNWSKIK